MSNVAPNNEHGELVINERLTDDLAREGFHLRPGTRLRFEVVDGKGEEEAQPPPGQPEWPPAWFASFEGPADLAATVKERLWGTEEEAVILLDAGPQYSPPAT